MHSSQSLCAGAVRLPLLSASLHWKRMPAPLPLSVPNSNLIVSSAVMPEGPDVMAAVRGGRANRQ